MPRRNAAGEERDWREVEKKERGHRCALDDDVSGRPNFAGGSRVRKLAEGWYLPRVGGPGLGGAGRRECFRGEGPANTACTAKVQRTVDRGTQRVSARRSASETPTTKDALQ